MSMNVDRRRRVPRTTVDNWTGRWRVEGQGDEHEAICTVLDLSLLGVGIEVQGDRHGDLDGKRLVVEVIPPVGNSISLRMVGDVKNVRAVGEHARIGLEFIELSQNERDILEVFQAMKIFW